MPVRMLTPSERRDRGIRLARVLRERERRKAEHAEENRTYRDEIKSLSKEIETLSREVEDGYVVEDAQSALFAAPEEPPAPAGITETAHLSREQYAVLAARPDPTITGGGAVPSSEPALEEPATPAPVRQTCSRCGGEVAETIALSPAGDGASTPPLCPACFEAATATVQAAFSGVDPAILEDDDDEEEEDDA